MDAEKELGREERTNGERGGNWVFLREEEEEGVPSSLGCHMTKGGGRMRKERKWKKIFGGENFPKKSVPLYFSSFGFKNNNFIFFLHFLLGWLAVSDYQ